MALNLITKADTTGKGVTGLADTPGLTASEMQQKFDELSMDVIIPKFNENITKLNADDAAKEIKMATPDDRHFGPLKADSVDKIINTISKAVFDIADGDFSPAQTIQRELDGKADESQIAELRADFQHFTDDVRESVDGVEQTAKDAETVADNAMTVAGEAKTHADLAESISNNALTAANIAKTEVETSIAKADTAIAKADNADSNAEDALDKATTANANASKALTDVQTANTLASEAKVLAEEALEEAQKSSVRIDDDNISNVTVYSSSKVESDFAKKSVANASNDGLMSSADFTKLSGIEAQANKYVHPSFTAKSEGLYKVGVNNQGHVSSASAVTKADITGLGIPAQDTVYTHPSFTARTSGLYKITVNNQGHVSGATAVTKDDITGLGILGTDGGTLTENLTYNMYNRSSVPLSVYGGNSNGHGVRLGDGAATIVGAGESSISAEEKLKATSEQLWLTSDEAIFIHSGCSNDMGSYKRTIIDTSGNLYPEASSNSAATLGTTSAPWNHVYANNYHGGTATTSADGLMSAADKTKLDGVDKALFDATAIPAGADINNYRTAGFYYCTAANSASVSNLPPIGGKGFVLEVIGGGTRWIQLLHTLASTTENHDVYTRTATTTDWWSWVRLDNNTINSGYTSNASFAAVSVPTGMNSYTKLCDIAFPSAGIYAVKVGVSTESISSSGATEIPSGAHMRLTVGPTSGATRMSALSHILHPSFNYTSLDRIVEVTEADKNSWAVNVMHILGRNLRFYAGYEFVKLK